MDGRPPARAPWVLSAESFARLLRSFDPDPGAAAAEYERLRHRLATFFDWRGLSDAEAAVDETFDRVARRLAEGETIEHFKGYAYGVARVVFKETQRLQRQQADSVANLKRQLPCPDEPVRELQRTCLDRCLEGITPRSRQLILEYYGHRGRGKSAHHQRQAVSLQLSAAALRVAAYRIRMSLEQCVEQCVAQQ
jgi:DNA-directed RNA polymerase specialized sigma24 family protein